jgi:CyaY protein
MDAQEFTKRAYPALEHIDEILGGLELEELDSDLAGDVLTLEFSDGGKFILNAHGAARQVWLAAGTTAWHFDYQQDGRWVAPKTGDELMSTVARVVGEKLGRNIEV